ncbi:unnamed protein product, partial [marine sediment metagenome]
LGLKAFKASEKAKPPLTEQDKKVEELLRKDLTLDKIAKEIGIDREEVKASLDHIDLPGLFSKVKGLDGSEHPPDAVTCYRLLNVNKLTLTQASEKCKEIYAKVMAEHAQADDKLAVEKLLTNCAYMAYCADHAVTLSETWWWSEGQILSFFGEPGREKYHELSSPYRTDHSAYTEKETNAKFDEAIKAGNKGIAPHRCDTIQQTHGFDCPENCLARKMKIKSPAGLARV